MATQETSESAAGGCCAPAAADAPLWQRIDWLLWGSLLVIAAGVALHFLAGDQIAGISWLSTFAESTYRWISVMWWSLLLAILFVGLLSKIPREFVMGVLGDGNGTSGIVRAAAAGVLLDLCNHGILMVGMQLYRRGASLGQVFAFLIASPWNSISVTIILIALIGLGWTLAFIALSLIVALITGIAAQHLVKRGTLPANANTLALPADFRFWSEAKRQFADIRWTPRLFREMAVDGAKESRMVMRWILFGVVLAALLQTFVPPDAFQNWFGPTLAGLGLTLVAATIIEVCSEGSVPIAADLLGRGGAPGNGFTFLMAGAATDYTEIMSLRETTGRWAMSLALPLLTVPQILIVGWLLNTTAAG